MLPEGWKEILLDSVTKRGSGHTPNKEHPEYWDGGIKWVSLADSSKLDDRYIFSTEKEISSLGIVNSSAVLHKAGTVILSRDAAVGKSALLADDMAVSQHFIAWQCSNYIFNIYLYYFLQKEKKEFERQAIGSTIKTIGLPYFKKLKILLPSIAEQKKIADILWTWDEAIAVVDKQLENCRQQKKALMQQLLMGNRRLPEFSGEWKKVRLSSFCNRITEKNNGQCSLVATISAQYGLIRQEEFFNKSVASETLDNYFILRKGNFAYNKSYSIGYPMGAIKRLNRYDKAVVTSLYICFKLDEKKADSDFFEFFFDSGLLDKSLTQIAAEGGRAHGLLNVRPDDFMGIQILFPSLKEQTAIAKVLSTSVRQIELLEQKLESLQEEKKSLMQQLLTGKKRVTV